MRPLVFFCLLTVSALIPNLGFGQIQAPSANFSDTVYYPKAVSYPSTDSIFVFNYENDDAYIIADTLTYSNHTFKWEYFAPGIGYIPLSTTNPRMEISDTAASQGFKITISDTTTAICWVVFNDFDVEVISKDDEGNITRDALSSSDCVWIGYIEVAYTRSPLNYYDTANHDTLNFYLDFTTSYTATPELPSGIGVMTKADPLNGLERFAINNSWWEDAVYDIEFTDDAGLLRSDDVNVTAIRPKAEIESADYVYLNDKEFYPDRDTLYYRAYNEEYNSNNSSAPGFYEFTSGAFNADSIIWYFGDSTSITTADQVVYHDYRAYGNYEVTMEAINYFDFRQECSDMSEITDIELSKPELSAPNVFSPPGGENPIWRYTDVSITDFDIVIYNRIGQKVHSFKGNVRDWGGWDGTKNNSSSYVSTGVYFYVLKDFSHAPNFNVGNDNNPEFGDTVYKGYIHVYTTE